MRKRVTRPKVSAADLSKMAQFLREAGAKIATAEIAPDGTYKVVTIDGAYLTAPKTEAQDSWGHLKIASR